MKNKRLKIHLCAGQNPRLNVKNMPVTNTVLSTGMINIALKERIKKPELRKEVIYIPEKEYQMFMIDIKKKVKLSNNTFEPDIYIFADGVLFAQLRSVENRPIEKEKPKV